MLTHRLLRRFCPHLSPTHKAKARRAFLMLFLMTLTLTLISIVIDLHKAQDLGLTALLDQIVGGVSAGLFGKSE